VTPVAEAKPKRVAVPKPVAAEKPAPASRKKQVADGPEAAPAPRRKRAKPIPADRLAALVAAAKESLEADKAEDILVLDVTGRASFTDWMIIATGQVERQIQAMAAHLEDALEKVGLKLRRDAIQGSPDWVLIDCGDLVVHLFKPEARVTYALERMWGPDSPAGENTAPPPSDDEAEPEGDTAPDGAIDSEIDLDDDDVLDDDAEPHSEGG
jgi:ribosome silencing factor RsfS/YbeB/iojap